MGHEPQQIGKVLIISGTLLILLGGLLLVLGRAGLFRLPGDLNFGGKNWRVYIPATSCILLSVLITGLLWLIHWLRR